MNNLNIYKCELTCLLDVPYINSLQWTKATTNIGNRSASEGGSHDRSRGTAARQLSPRTHDWAGRFCRSLPGAANLPVHLSCHPSTTCSIGKRVCRILSNRSTYCTTLA